MMTLEQLAKQRFDIKANIDYQAEILADIDKEIEALLEVKDEGTTHLIVGNLKVTATGKLARSINADALESAFKSGSLPQAVAAYCFKWKPSLDLKNYRNTLKEQPDHITNIIKTIVTEKPAKTAITVEVIQNESVISEHSQHQSP